MVVRRLSPMGVHWLLYVLPLLAGCVALRGGLPTAPALFPVDGASEARAMGHFLKAKIALDTGDYARATAEYENAVAADPDSIIPRMRLATLYVRAGDLLGANEQCEAIMAAAPDHIEARLLGAGVLTALGRDDAAMAQYDEVLTREPENQEACLYLGALYAKQNRTDEALATFQKLIEINPESVLGITIWGGFTRCGNLTVMPKRRFAGLCVWTHARAGRHCTCDHVPAAGAEGQSDRVVRAVHPENPKNLMVRRRLGALLVDERKFDEALEAIP